METAFGDIVSRLTEAALVADQMSVDEVTALYAEAARTIQDLRDVIEELREVRSEVAAERAKRPAASEDRANCR